ncbi:MAG TPA: hypothetical protein VF062_00775 [Candidatus Limnocylindrales bacterium]
MSVVSSAASTLLGRAPDIDPSDPSYDPSDPTQYAQCVDSGNIWTNWFTGHACDGTSRSVVGTAIQNTVLEPWVQDAKNGVADSVKTMVTFWVDVPSPAVGNIEDGSKSEVVSFLQGGLMPIAAWTMCFVMLASVATIMWTQRAAGARTIMTMLLTYLAVESVGVGAIAVALEVTDNTSKWLIDQSTQGTNFADNLFSLFDSTPGVAAGLLLIVLLLIASLVAVFTCVLMIARGGILLALTGAMLFAVAASGIEAGKQVTRHYFGWILAFILYKLAGAIVYSVGFRLVGTDTSAQGQGLLQILYGLTLLSMAVLALPAIIRLVVPLVAPAAQGRGAGAMAGAAGAAVASSVARR